MDEETLINSDAREEETHDEREEETHDEIRDEDYANDDEIRDEDYANDDEIEMNRSIEEKLDKVMGKLDSIYDTISMFVDSGMVIREPNPLDGDEDITEDDFASDFMSIDDLDFSID